jgi:hypothetical protein
MERERMASYEVEVVEKDEAGNVIATYVASGEGRVDVIVCTNKQHCSNIVWRIQDARWS